jgi:hypothetical protein
VDPGGLFLERDANNANVAGTLFLFILELLQTHSGHSKNQAPVVQPAAMFASSDQQMPYHWFDDPHDAVKRHVWGTRQNRHG